MSVEGVLCVHKQVCTATKQSYVSFNRLDLLFALMFPCDSVPKTNLSASSVNAPDIYYDLSQFKSSSYRSFLSTLIIKPLKI